MRPIIVLPLMCVLFAAFNLCAETDDLDTQLMLNTFKISNPKSSATVFVIVRPSPDDAKKNQYVLVSALHVFSKMEGDEATLYLRKKEGKDSDEWAKVAVKLKVREDGKALWTKHPNADVAVLPFSPPPDAPVAGLPLSLLATDEMLKHYEIHPGDTLKCTGYPHPNQFDTGAAWFPVVRQGCIAGFPLTPSTKYKTFLADFNTFEGNSGGPVYFTENNRYYGGKTQEGRIQFILGLLSLQHFINDKYDNVYESGTFRHRLCLGVIVNAAMIRETIELLPKSALKSEK